MWGGVYSCGKNMNIYYDKKKLKRRLKRRTTKGVGEGGNVHCTWGKKYYFEKNGEGQKDPILGNMYHWIKK